MSNTNTNKGTRKGNKGRKGTTKNVVGTFPISPELRAFIDANACAIDASGQRIRDIAQGEGETGDAYETRCVRIVALWDKLRGEHTRNDGKRIRRQLRALGHFGGMRHERGTRNNVPLATNVTNGERPPLGKGDKGTRDAC